MSNIRYCLVNYQSNIEIRLHCHLPLIIYTRITRHVHTICLS